MFLNLLIDDEKKIIDNAINQTKMIIPELGNIFNFEYHVVDCGRYILRDVNRIKFNSIEDKMNFILKFG